MRSLVLLLLVFCTLQSFSATPLDEAALITAFFQKTPELQTKSDKRAKAYQKRAILRISKKKWSSALKLINRSLKLNPTLGYSYYLKGQTLFFMKKYDQALKYLRAGSGSQIKESERLMYIAMIQFRQKNWEESEKVLLSILEIDKTGSYANTARIYLGAIQTQKSEYSEALENLEDENLNLTASTRAELKKLSDKIRSTAVDDISNAYQMAAQFRYKQNPLLQPNSNRLSDESSLQLQWQGQADIALLNRDHHSLSLDISAAFAQSDKDKYAITDYSFLHLALPWRWSFSEASFLRTELSFRTGLTDTNEDGSRDNIHNISGLNMGYYRSISIRSQWGLYFDYDQIASDLKLSSQTIDASGTMQTIGAQYKVVLGARKNQGLLFDIATVSNTSNESSFQFRSTRADATYVFSSPARWSASVTLQYEAFDFYDADRSDTWITVIPQWRYSVKPNQTLSISLQRDDYVSSLSAREYLATSVMTQYQYVF